MLKRLRRDERGFTMVTVMLSMMVLSMLAVGAMAGVVGDMPVARKDQDRKRAYEAAQAGVDWYLNMLRANPDYWQSCAPPTPTDESLPLTLEDAGSGGAWKTSDGDSNNPAPTDSKFRVEIMNGRKALGPAAGTPCNKSNPSGTALDDNGIFWIRSSGKAGGKVRSILAGLQQNNDFLKYVYFSNWESQDPQLANATGMWPSGSNRNLCDYIKTTRDDRLNSNFGQMICLAPQYRTGDVISGSMHTNDAGFMACGAQLGGSSSDKIEVAGAVSNTKWNSRSDVFNYGDRPAGPKTLGYKCPDYSGNPTPTGTVVAPAPTLQLPPSNVKLLKQAETDPGNLVLQGQTCLNFVSAGQVEIFDSPTFTAAPSTAASRHKQWGSGAGTQADPKGVNCEGAGKAPRTVSIPSGGIIYVKNQDGVGCTPRLGHNAATSYSSSPGCGDVAIKGTYGRSVTIGAENDIIIRGDLTRDGDYMLGLIANGYVRLYNPLTGDPYRYNNQENVTEGDAFVYNWDCTNWWCPTYPSANYMPCGPTYFLNNWFAGRQQRVTTFTPVKKVQAAILSMQHTFITDNANCPFEFTADQNLEFEGSISVYWGSQIGGCALAGCAGYKTRNWKHDTRFKRGQPPHFITPLNSDGRWTVTRRSEQVPTPVGTS